MKKITDSFIFNQLLKNGKVKTSIKNISVSRDGVSPAAIEEQLRVINKKMKFAGKDKVADIYAKGGIVPIYNPSLELPKYLNTMLKQENGQLVAIIDLTNLSRINAEGTCDIYPKTLFSLMQNGTISYELFTNWNRYTTNATLVRNGAIIYSKLMGKVLDKLYAIKIDQFRADLIHFLLAKFFIVNMCDRIPTENVDRLAYASAFNESTYELILDEASAIDDDAFSDLESFLAALKELGMKSLNIRIFLENYARMYGETTILAMDYLPAFFGTIFSVAINGNLAKDYIIESVCGKQLQSLYLEFFKLVR